MNISILYEDKNFLIINKPAGLLTHSPAGKNQPSLTDWLIKNYPEVQKVGDEPETRPGIVHRLDRDTSGVMLIARNQKTFDYFKSQFQEHEVKKTYIALVWDTIAPKEGIIEKPIGLKTGTTKRTVHLKTAKMIKEAKTKYKVIKFLKLGNNAFSLVEVQPLTGRTHQIRIHFASIGHPIVGDKLYGKRETLGLSRHFLHAESLEFTLPKTGRLKIAADLPEELTIFLKQFATSGLE